MRYAAGVAGTKVGFAYERSQHFAAASEIRREAERDAAEARAVAEEYRATRAIGFSRGARALVGVLADGPSPFERIALVMPPGGRAAGKYAAWIESRPASTGLLGGTEVLVVAHSGDAAHPSRIAKTWADQLGARLELLPARSVSRDIDRVATLLAQFLN